MTKRDLKRDLEIVRKATPGPWDTAYTTDDTYVLDDCDNIVAASEREEDAEFIAEAREGWAHAIERALKAEEENARMRDAIMQLDRAFSRGKNLTGPIHRCFMAANGFEYKDEYKTMEERALAAEAEVEQLREIISTECPAGAFDIVTSLKAERELLKEQIAELKAENRRLREVIDDAFCYLQIDPRKSIEILRREFTYEGRDE